MIETDIGGMYRPLKSNMIMFCYGLYFTDRKGEVAMETEDVLRDMNFRPLDVRLSSTCRLLGELRNAHSRLETVESHGGTCILSHADDNTYDYLRVDALSLVGTRSGNPIYLDAADAHVIELYVKRLSGNNHNTFSIYVHIRVPVGAFEAATGISVPVKCAFCNVAFGFNISANIIDILE